MTKIRFPAPYEVEYVPIGKRNAVKAFVENWITLDIPDVDETTAMVVASFDKDFPDGVFETGYTNQKTVVAFSRPRTEVRVHDDQFYYPLFSYNTEIAKNGGLTSLQEYVPERLGIENFITGFSGSRRNVSAFGTCHGLPTKGLFINHRFITQITKQLADELPTLETLPGVVERTDQVSIENCYRELESYLISINGDIWILGDEPMIVAHVGHLGAEIKLQRRTTADARYYEEDHPFRLDRLEDCLAHVAENFPAHDIDLQFGNLEVVLPEVLRFEDELQPLHGAARKVVDLSEGRVMNMPYGQAMAWYDLRDAVEPYREIDPEDFDVREPILTEETSEPVFEALKAFNDASKGCLDTKPYAFALAAVERWKLRPTVDRPEVATPKRY